MRMCPSEYQRPEQLQSNVYNLDSSLDTSLSMAKERSCNKSRDVSRLGLSSEDAAKRPFVAGTHTSNRARCCHQLLWNQFPVRMRFTTSITSPASPVSCAA